MKNKLKMNLSFPKYEKDIYDFIKSQPNPSAFIRKLVEAYMNGTIDKFSAQQARVNKEAEILSDLEKEESSQKYFVKVIELN